MIYQSNHPGIALEATGAKQAARNENLFQGFFHSSDLTGLLDQENCVGIRIYNVDAASTTDRRLIAIGVSSDGSELNQPVTEAKYLLSPAVTPIGSGAEKMSRTRAKDTIEAPAIAGVARSDIFFASYFSKTMIDSLLKSPQEDVVINGVRFYVTPQLAGLPGSITHCGVSAVVKDGLITVPDQAVHLVSDRPCPGFCVNSDPEAQSPEASELESTSRVALPAGVAAFPGKDLEKYLVIW